MHTVGRPERYPNTSSPACPLTVEREGEGGGREREAKGERERTKGEREEKGRERGQRERERWLEGSKRSAFVGTRQLSSSPPWILRTGFG